MASMPLGSVESFAVDREGFLVRSVIPARGAPYEHRCSLDTLTAVSNEVSDLGDHGFTGEELARRLGRPFSQVATAVAFLRERGCIEVCGRRNFVPRGNDAYLDIMVEYHALREGETAQMNTT